MSTLRKALLGGLLLFSLAVPASASAGNPGSCPRGYFCAWEHANYEGRMFAWYGNDSGWDYTTPRVDWRVENNTSSWANNGHPGYMSTVEVYDGYWGWGAKLMCLRTGYALNYSHTANDRPSSHYWRNHSC